MANIFVAMYNFGRDSKNLYKMPPFLESFIFGFEKSGNCVLCYCHKTYGREFDEPIPENILQKLKNFNPELCILFNNNFWDISDIVECPIIIYDIDSVLEFKGLNHIKKNIRRYLFIVNQTKAVSLIQDQLSANENQICLIPFFTEIYPDETSATEHNINFLGTNWLWKGYNFARLFAAQKASKTDQVIAKKTLNEFLQDPFSTGTEIINANGWHPQIPLKITNLKRTAIELSGIRRLRYLSAVSDLDLEIRGAYWDINCMNYFPDVALCYNPVSTISLLENQEFYNSAKISLNTKHIQAQNGFSFRVCDIMASNACLVTEYCKDLKQLFPAIPLPMFTSEAEIREHCLYILKNENYRREIVDASHEIIEKNHRFKNVLAEIETFTGLILHTSLPGDLIFFSDDLPQIEEPDKSHNITKYLGHQPYEIRTTKKLSFGCFRFRCIKHPDNVTDIYLYDIPLLRLRNNGSNTKIQILAWQKAKTLWRIRNRDNNLYKKASQLSLKKEWHRKKLKKKWQSGEKIKIVLFVSRISCWLFDELYEILLDSKHFEPIIVLKPFMSQGKEAMINYQETTYEALCQKGYHPVRGYDIENDNFLDVRKELNPDIVFYTLFWKPHFHDYFYIDRFLDKISFLTPYGFYVAEDRRAMNFELNNLVDGFFMATPFHKDMAVRDMCNHGKNVYITGAPKLDIFFKHAIAPENVWKKQDQIKKKIIWAPHHEDKTPSWQYQFDAFYELADFMLELADIYKETVQFAFKPHPMLKDKLYKRWGEDNTNAYYDLWNSKENCQLEEGEFEYLFLESDAMILDSISFIAEYTATNKPALFTLGRQSRLFLNEYGQENYKVLYEAKDNLKQEICHFIDDVVLAGKDSKAPERAKFVDKYLIPQAGKSASQNIYDVICEKILN